jgi:hypothetical protein
MSFLERIDRILSELTNQVQNRDLNSAVENFSNVIQDYYVAINRKSEATHDVAANQDLDLLKYREPPSDLTSDVELVFRTLLEDYMNSTTAEKVIIIESNAVSCESLSDVKSIINFLYLCSAFQMKSLWSEN